MSDSITSHSSPCSTPQEELCEIIPSSMEKNILFPLAHSSEQFIDDHLELPGETQSLDENLMLKSKSQIKINKLASSSRKLTKKHYWNKEEVLLYIFLKYISCSPTFLIQNLF